MQVVEGGRQLEPRQQCPAQINDRYPALQRDNRIRLIRHRCNFSFLPYWPHMESLNSFPLTGWLRSGNEYNKKKRSRKIRSSFGFSFIEEPFSSSQYFLVGSRCCSLLLIKVEHQGKPQRIVQWTALI